MRLGGARCALAPGTTRVVGCLRRSSNSTPCASVPGLCCARAVWSSQPRSGLRPQKDCHRSMLLQGWHRPDEGQWLPHCPSPAVAPQGQGKLTEHTLPACLPSWAVRRTATGRLPVLRRSPVGGWGERERGQGDMFAGRKRCASVNPGTPCPDARPWPGEPTQAPSSASAWVLTRTPPGHFRSWNPCSSSARNASHRLTCASASRVAVRSPRSTVSTKVPSAQSYPQPYRRCCPTNIFPINIPSDAGPGRRVG